MKTVSIVSLSITIAALLFLGFMSVVSILSTGESASISQTGENGADVLARTTNSHFAPSLSDTFLEQQNQDDDHPSPSQNSPSWRNADWAQGRPEPGAKTFSFVDKNGARISKKNGLMTTELPNGEVLYLPDEL